MDVVSQQSSQAILGPPNAKTAQSGSIAAGLFIAIGYAVMGLYTIAGVPLSVEVNVLTIVVVPFIMFFLLTRNFTDALLLVWMNEVFFGGNGHWLELGPISGRWLLLLSILVFGMIERVRDEKKTGGRPKFASSIMFYGVWFPLWLVIYSAGIQGNNFWKVIGDVNYLYVLLIYFPIRSFIRRRYFLFQGWLFGVILILAALSLFLALAPPQIGLPLYWAVAGEAITGTTASGITRAAFLGQVFLFVGYFIGLFYLGDYLQTKKYRLAGLILWGISLAPLSLLFLRGLLFAILLVMVFFILACVYNRIFSVAKWFVITGLFFVFGTGFMYVKIIPEAIERFTLIDDDYVAYLSDSRVEQAGLMMDLFREKPVFGHGVGSPVIVGGQERFDFELQYNMLLYRVGILNMGVLLLPIIWFFKELFFILRVKGRLIHQIKVKILLAILLSILAIFIAGAMNPYLLAVYTPLLIVVYLSYREIVLASV